MISTLMLAGLVTGFLPGPWRLIGAGAVVAAWPLLLVSGGADADPASVLGALAFAAGNTGLGVFKARKIVATARALARPCRDGRGRIPQGAAGH